MLSRYIESTCQKRKRNGNRAKGIRLTPDPIDYLNEKPRLMAVDAMLRSYVRLGLLALAAENYLLGAFGKSPNAFKSHILNSSVFWAIRSLIAQSAINAHELLDEDKRDFGSSYTFEVRDSDFLMFHRLYRAHPWTKEWTNKKMQALFDDERIQRDNLAVRLVRVRTSFIRRLEEIGVKNEFPLEVDADPGMVAMMRKAFELTLKNPSGVLSDFEDKMSRYFPSYGKAIIEMAAEGDTGLVQDDRIS